MDEYHRTKQSPGTTLSVNVQHAQYLEEADASDRGRCEHLAIWTDWQHHYGSYNYN